MEDLVTTKSRTALQRMFMRLKAMTQSTAEITTLNILKPLVTPDVTGIAPTALPAAGGDLSGTLDDATVESIQGVAISGTPAIGDTLVATSATTAEWSGSAAAAAIVTNGDADFPEIVFDDGDIVWDG